MLENVQHDQLHRFVHLKARGYHASVGVDSLQVVPVSQAQARQRSGRAGWIHQSAL